VIDGEVVALDEQRRPSFNLLQNSRSSASHIIYYAFDIPYHSGEDMKQLPLEKRRAILAKALKLSDRVGLSQVSEMTAAQMIEFERSHGLEGVIAKRANSLYQPGKRSGMWTRTRINMGQEFVETAERYIGCKQRLRGAVNYRLGIEPA
jgi:bifunctional non-homologous end joining protein LigD